MAKLSVIPRRVTRAECRQPRPRGSRIVAVVAGMSLTCSQTVHAQEFDARVKLFSAVASLPDTDIQRAHTGSPAIDGSADLRLMFSGQGENFSYELHHTTLLISGDSFFDSGIRELGFDQVTLDDNSRSLDLSWELHDGARHQFAHRIDRAAITFQGQKTSLTVGRDALSWGNGKVFNPMDLFSPFAPTTLDRDFKPGDDLVRLDRLLDGGDDVQAVAVLRRDRDGHRNIESASYGTRWHMLLDDREVDLVLGRHRDETIVGLSYRVPLQGAMLSTDWLATDAKNDGGWALSGVVSVDYSLELAGRSAYVFAEYYRNGFGIEDDVINLAQMPEALVTRLSAGEVFGLMKHYLSVGFTYQWHPLITQTLVGITNLHDDSSLWQTSISIDPSDNQRLDFGMTLTTGGIGEEYGTIDIPMLSVVERATTGGTDRVFLRWVYYW